MRSTMKKTQAVSFGNVDITGGFWEAKQKMNREVTLYSVRDRFTDTGRFEAFRFNWMPEKDDEIPRPHFFWDSDVAKWLESACYIIRKHPDDELLAEVDDVIDLIEKNQQEDGYFNIYHTVVEPEMKFSNRDHHELYCLGHLIEAAVAYLDATGSSRFIDILDKYIDLVIRRFTVDRDVPFSTPGHEEIELALIKLYRAKKDKKYLDLARFFINERGQTDEYRPDWAKASYYQSHAPVREQFTAEGHSVRACYLYSGMADLANETEEEELFNVCKKLFENISQKRMYITGGVGASHHGEAFTVDYDLPNDTAYTETCASIALYFFANRMKDLELNSVYADVAEKAMYNGIIAGVSLDGRSFFYENPLEINVSDHYRNVSVEADDRLPITQRLEVFGCSCCPPNLTRFIASIGDSVFSKSDNAIIMHQFMPLTADIDQVSVSVETNYPNDGKIDISLAGGKGKKFYIRIPGWCRNCNINSPFERVNGYAEIDITEDLFDISVDFDIVPDFMLANPGIRHDAGKAALICGPLVYCMEKKDNDFDLFDVMIDTSEPPVAEFSEKYGCSVITAKGFISDKESFSALYGLKKEFGKIPVEAKFIPYHAFANEGETDMAVWFRYN